MNAKKTIASSDNLNNKPKNSTSTLSLDIEVDKKACLVYRATMTDSRPRCTLTVQVDNNKPVVVGPKEDTDDGEIIDFTNQTVYLEKGSHTIKWVSTTNKKAANDAPMTIRNFRLKDPKIINVHKVDGNSNVTRISQALDDATDLVVIPYDANQIRFDSFTSQDIKLKAQYVTSRLNESGTKKENHPFIGWFSDEECTIPYPNASSNTKQTLNVKVTKDFPEELNLYAKFDVRYDLTVKSQKAGSCTASILYGDEQNPTETWDESKTQYLPADQTIYFEANHADDTEFIGWYENDELITDDRVDGEKLTLNMESRPHSIEARFKEAGSLSLTVHKNTSLQNSSCVDLRVEQGDEQFLAQTDTEASKAATRGTRYTLVAKPMPVGSEINKFVGWYTDPTYTDPYGDNYTDPVQTVTVNEDMHIYAKFAPLVNAPEGFSFGTGMNINYDTNDVRTASTWVYDDEHNAYKTEGNNGGLASLGMDFYAEEGQVLCFDYLISSNPDAELFDYCKRTEIPTGSDLYNDWCFIGGSSKGAPFGAEYSEKNYTTGYLPIDKTGNYRWYIYLDKVNVGTDEKPVGKNAAWVKNFRFLDPVNLTVKAEPATAKDKGLNEKDVAIYESGSGPIEADDETFVGGEGGGLEWCDTLGAGMQVYLRADDVANSGYVFSGWYKDVDGSQDLVTNDRDLIITINENVTYVAKYRKATKYTYAVSYNSEVGTVTHSEKKNNSNKPYTVLESNPYEFKNVVEGSTHYFTATPYEGYIFDGWYENGKRISKTQQRFCYTVSGNNQLQAVFRQPATDLKFTANVDNAEGTVVQYKLGESDQWINLTDGAVSGLSEGTTLTVQAVVPAGTFFEGWYEDGDRQALVSNTFTATVTFENKDISLYGFSKTSSLKPIDGYVYSESKYPFVLQTRDVNQWSVNKDGVLIPGNADKRNSVSTMAVTVHGEGEIQFWYKTSTEEKNDILLYGLGSEITSPAKCEIADNIGQVDDFSGVHDNWKQVKVPVVADDDEESTLFITYRKDDADTNFHDDLVYVKDIQFVDRTVAKLDLAYDSTIGIVKHDGEIVLPGPVQVDLDSEIVFTAEAKQLTDSELVPKFVGWYWDDGGADVKKGTDNTYHFNAEDGKLTAKFELTDEKPINDYFDTGEGNDIKQLSTFYPFWNVSTLDGKKVLTPGNQGMNSSISLLKLDIKTPGMLNFRLKTSTEKNFDALLYSNERIAMDNWDKVAFNHDNRAETSGVKDWFDVSILVDAGPFYLAYYKDISDNGKDNGDGTFNYEDMIWISDLDLVTEDQPLIVTASNGTYGNVTVTANGEEIKGPSVDKVVPLGCNVQLKAEPTASGEFYGWFDSKTESLISTNPNYTFQLTRATTLRAEFAAKGHYEARTDSKLFETLADALGDAEKNGETVYLVKNGATVNGLLEVPAGVTLLLPLSNTDTTGYVRNDNGAPVQEEWKKGMKPYLTLAVAPGANLTVNGTLVVGGTRHAANQAAQGITSGPYAQLVNSGSITIGSGGKFTVNGLVTGTGTITAESGSNSTVPFTVNDYSGGTNTETLYYADDFPFHLYATPNVQCPFVVKGGATVLGSASLYFWSTIHEQDVALIGPSGGAGLILLGSGSTLTATYDDSKVVNATIGAHHLGDFGKQTLTIDGGATAGIFDLSGYGSSDKYLFLPYNFDVVVKSGTLTVPATYKYRIMPGATVTVNEGATLDIQSGGAVDVVDGWQQTPLSNSAYPSTAQLGNAFSKCGNLVVNGTLNVPDGATFTGIVQTTGTSGRIAIGQSATLQALLKAGAKTDYGNNQVTFSNSARVRKGDETTELVHDKTYYAAGADGWTLESYTMNGTGISTPKQTINQPMSGKWVSPSITYKYCDDDATPDKTIHLAPGADIPSETPTREGYDFLGWFTAETDGEKFEATTMPSEELTLYAHWQNSSCTVTFNPNGGAFTGNVQRDESGNAIQSYKYKDKLANIPEVEKPGYSLSGWQDQNGKTVGENAEVTGDMVLTAQWTEGEYKIRYYLNDGGTGQAKWPAGNEDFATKNATYTIESPEIHVPNPEWVGHTFLGWKVNGTEGEQKDYVIGNRMTGDLTLIAQWQTNSHTVTWVFGNGSENIEVPTEFGTEIANQNDPKRDGYRFDNWKVTGTQSGKDYGTTIPESMPDEDLTITAQWSSYLDLLKGITDFTAEGELAKAHDYFMQLTDEQKRSYDATKLIDAIVHDGIEDVNGKLVDEAGNRIATLSFDSNKPNTILVYMNNPNTKAKKMLEIPFLTKLFGTDEVSTLMVNSNKVNKQDQFNIMLQVAYAALAGQPDIPKGSDDFYFWLQGQQDVITIGVLAGTTVPAQLLGADGHGPTYNVSFYDDMHKPGDSNTAMVEFDLAGGSGVSNITTKIGSLISDPGKPAKTGYDFSGWLKDGKPFTFNENTIMPEGGMELTATWTPIHYTINFEAGTVNGKPVQGKLPDSITNLAYDAKQSLPGCDIEVTGYSFAGWSIPGEAEGTVHPMGETVSGLCTGDGDTITLTASWVAETYTVTLDPGEHGVLDTGDPSEITVTFDAHYGDAPELRDGMLPTPKRAGYDFLNWEIEGTGEAVSENTAVSTASDHTLVPAWNATGDTPYIVVTRTQALDGESYEETKVEFKSKADTTVRATVKPPEGFHLNKADSLTEATLDAEGKTVLTVTYDRDPHTVTWQVDGTDVQPEPTVFLYGQTATYTGVESWEDDASHRDLLGWGYPKADGSAPDRLEAMPEVKGDMILQAVLEETYEAETPDHKSTWRTLAIAMANAPKGTQDNPTIVSLHCEKAEDGTVKPIALEGDLTVPSGIMLLVPYALGDTGYDTVDNHNQGIPGPPVAGGTPTDRTGAKGTEFSKLTIPDGATLTVQGRVLVNALIGRNAESHHDQEVTGGYGHIVLGNGSKVVVGNGGTFDCHGYVDGEGTVTAQSGGTVGDLFVVRNWRGGSQAAAIIGKTYPYNEYDCHNISVPVTINAGGTLEGLVTMHASGAYYSTRFPLVDPSNGIIRQTSGSTTRTYDGKRETWTVDGGADFSRSTLKIIDMNLSTGGFVYPIDGDMDFVLTNGDFSFSEDYKFLTGATVTCRNADVTVERDATVVLYQKFDDPVNTDDTKYPDRPAAWMSLDAKSSLTNYGEFAGKVNAVEPSVHHGEMDVAWEVSTWEANGYYSNKPFGQETREIKNELDISCPGHTYEISIKGEVLWDGAESEFKPVEEMADIIGSGLAGAIGGGEGGTGDEATVPVEGLEMKTTLEEEGNITIEIALDEERDKGSAISSAEDAVGAFLRALAARADVFYSASTMTGKDDYTVILSEGVSGYDIRMFTEKLGIVEAAKAQAEARAKEEAEKAAKAKALAADAETLAETTDPIGSDLNGITGKVKVKGTEDYPVETTVTLVFKADEVEPEPEPEEPNLVAVYRLYNPYDGQHLLTTNKYEYDSLNQIGWRKEGIESYQPEVEAKVASLAESATAPAAAQTVVYRLYNPNNGDHLYSAKAAEANSLVRLGWDLEGVAFASAEPTDEGAIPVYRLWNPYMTDKAGLGSHLYTSKPNEYTELGKLGWNQEDIYWYASPAPKPKTES